MEQQHTSRTGTGHSTATGIGAGVVGVCAVCGLRSAPGNVHGALLPDATVIDPQGRGRDGRRYVTACGREHLQLLIDRARRDWVAEQLWFGLLCRASIPPRMRACPGGGAGLGGRPLTRSPAPHGRLEHPQRRSSGHSSRRADTGHPAVLTPRRPPGRTVLLGGDRSGLPCQRP